MEKIQSAIAKARAARSVQLSGTEPTPTVLQVAEDRPPEPALAPSAAPAIAVAERENVGVTTSPADPLRQAHDISRQWMALPSVTILPKLMEQNRIPAFAGGPEATSFDMLRTRLMQQMAQNGWKRLAITSPGPGCGKTTLALNLAFALSRRADLRTILAEVDLRRPSAQKVIGQRHSHSFADVLAGRAAFADNAFRHGPNLIFATNEAASRTAADALHGDKVAAVLSQVEAEFDPSVWIFDMPPMLANDDALAFAGQVDCAVILAAAEMTSTKELDKCERELATQTNVLGVILNKCRYMDRHESYDYY